MVPFKETINTKQELIEACKKGFEYYSDRIISKNDFCMYFGFTHGKAITTFYKGNYEQLLLDGGFNSGSSAYFSAGINAWKNLNEGIYTFPPFDTNDVPLLLKDAPLQQIFYGAPGTGKSYKVKELTGEDNVVRTTFHPDSDYSTFVGAYKPTMKPVADKYKAVAGKDEEITYEFIPQAFLQAYIAAWNNSEEKVFLVIEEINRGNCAQIFGDLFQLLDRDGNGFSEYPIKADRDLAKYLNGKDERGNDVLVNKDGIKDGKLCLPSNLYIWATMNTSDQSLFPIDSAFKRRWDWKYIKIKKGINKDTKQELNWKIKVGKESYDWWEFVKAINNKIARMTSSADKQLGYFFCLADGKGEINVDTFVNKVAFYLWNDVFKDYAEDGSPLLKYKKKEDDTGESDLTFPDFFDESGEIDTNVVKQFVEKVMKDDEMDKPVE